MTPLKKTLTAAGLGSAMFIGGVFGAATSDVTGAGAQDADTPEQTEQAEQAEQAESTENNRADRMARKSDRRAALAELLGLSVDELGEALRSGSTLADVAEAQGVDVQVLVDFMVEQANAKIDEALASGRITEDEAAARRAGIVEKAEAIIDGTAERGEKGRHKGRSGQRGQGQRGERGQTVADVLGVSVEELREAKAAGTTIAELAEANGVAVDAVVEALIADAAARIETAVENGRITEEQAADKLDAIEERIEAMVNGEGETERSRNGRRGGARNNQDAAA